MNKISLMKNNNKLEESHDNKVTKNKKKNKFKKFLSSSMAVMVLTVGLSAPMNLRGDETEIREKREITWEEQMEKRKNAIDKLRKAGEKNIKEGLEGIKKADAEIAKSQAEIEDAKKKIEEADKKIEEAKKLCLNLNEWLNKADQYCSKNTCTKEENTLINTKKNEFNKNCTELLVTVDKGN